MVIEIEQAEQTWRLLWSHIACQIISRLPAHEPCEIVFAGYGWGLRNRHTQRALLIHPTAEGREIGDLSLTVRGEGGQVIPRYGGDLLRYEDQVTDIVETVVRSYLLDQPCAR
ncbi:MAG: hypothetical protein H7Z42_12555 [Roseiflexaceae bacterium]|nr:hypothetical protein [Roseiflexaceae bacterium]